MPNDLSVSGSRRRDVNGSDAETPTPTTSAAAEKQQTSAAETIAHKLVHSWFETGAKPPTQASSAQKTKDLEGSETRMRKEVASWFEASAKPPTTSPAAQTTKASVDAETRMREAVHSWADKSSAATAHSLETGNKIPIIPSDQLPAVMPKLENDIHQVRGDLAKTTDSKEKQALQTRLASLQSGWSQAATHAGLQPPGPNFDPRHCSVRDLNNAHQWVELGNCYPASAFSQSMTGPEQYRADLHSEWLLRMPGAMKQALSKNPNDPQVRAALGKELQRLGDRTGVKKGDTVPTLMKRCDDLLAAQAKANAKQTYIESDGYVGTDEQIRFHKGQQYVQTYLKTIIGTTTTGSLLANGTLLAGGDLEQAQTAGKIGNFMEAPFSGLAKQMKKNQERMNNAPTNHPKLDAAEVRSK